MQCSREQCQLHSCSSSMGAAWHKAHGRAQRPACGAASLIHVHGDYMGEKDGNLNSGCQETQGSINYPGIQGTLVDNERN